ncbi:hypothetical protein DFH28DRAFT_933730 [Melampsora americana]|nr:hypothetical protein DFH28DRAFT_933730 [Melampsora americana]
MAESLNIAAILKQNLELQQKQIEAQNKKKARASTGSIPNKTSTPSKSAKCSSSKKVPATPAPKTPVNPSRASGSKSATSRVKVSSSKKPLPCKHPDQLTHEDWPEGYEKTKNCFFTFIRIIWGLILLSAVPKAPDPAMVTEFNAHFSDVSALKAALDSPKSQDLVGKSLVLTLSKARQGFLKVGPGIVNVKEFFVMYAQEMFAKLGV